MLSDFHHFLSLQFAYFASKPSQYPPSFCFFLNETDWFLLIVIIFFASFQFEPGLWRSCLHYFTPGLRCSPFFHNLFPWDTFPEYCHNKRKVKLVFRYNLAPKVLECKIAFWSIDMKNRTEAYLYMRNGSILASFSSSALLSSTCEIRFHSLYSCTIPFATSLHNPIIVIFLMHYCK